jgi:CBS domain-containing protein
MVDAIARARFSRVPIVRKAPSRGTGPAAARKEPQAQVPAAAAKRPVALEGVGGARARPQRYDEVVGVLYAKDLVGYASGHLEGHAIADLLRPAFFVPRSTKCDRLFREFQRRKTHIALVVDEYGRLLGVVTMEDLLEELFGELGEVEVKPVVEEKPEEVHR